jgi:hypothetical protein
MAEFMLKQSMAPGCARIIREAIAKHGLGASQPQACGHE